MFPYSVEVRLLMLMPATRKYRDVRKKDRNVDWFASTVRSRASFSRRIKSLFILNDVLGKIKQSLKSCVQL